MTLAEWTAEVKGELQQAGFIVQIHCGFPLVPAPATFEEKKRLIELPMKLMSDRRIYAEGMLFVPAGSPQ